MRMPTDDDRRVLIEREVNAAEKAYARQRQRINLDNGFASMADAFGGKTSPSEAVDRDRMYRSKIATLEADFESALAGIATTHGFDPRTGLFHDEVTAGEHVLSGQLVGEMTPAAVTALDGWLLT